MDEEKLRILEKCISFLELKVYGLNNLSRTALSSGNLSDEITKVENTISNACIGHPNATALLGHVKILDQLMDPFYDDHQLETSKREVILSGETDIIEYAHQLKILGQNWPALNNKSYGELDKYTKDIEHLIENERIQRDLVKEQTTHLHKLLFRYEQLMLQFSLAFESLEKVITELEYKVLKKTEEENEI
ncbi:uncharacterized protein LOC126894439 [Daktulosphaira vitifoliae]|uniref:uncharacterized protein LOC126894439 n=1 Tax=Daktulosphaira vitifoliae TaxID=58002 RepID=UPI0021AA3E4B|nr:uncharacterized protein LOC126894439 [Daktulosphaira vitifoliae]